ncbi:MAG: hypothetical protein KDI19_13410, partial [Pseudomonadales bacterium]|nr:hypothetical protein [Pseudomonadales bacterium]
AEAGLSSSAAIGLAYLAILAAANDLSLSPIELVDLDRQIENNYLGLKNGILDPAAIALSESGCLSLIDCKRQVCERIAQGEPFRFVAVYSGIREPLVGSSKFNDRVAECMNAGAALRRLAGERNATPQPLGNTAHDEYEELKDGLEPTLARRARHFFTESRRVLAGAEAWRAGDAATFGALMNESALSSIHNYETGSPELIALFETLRDAEGVHGARFCGAGFRGCCVALVERNFDLDSLLDVVSERYLARYPQFASDMWAIETGAEAGLGRP